MINKSYNKISRLEKSEFMINKETRPGTFWIFTSSYFSVPEMETVNSFQKVIGEDSGIKFKVLSHVKLLHQQEIVSLFPLFRIFSFSSLHCCSLHPAHVLVVLGSHLPENQ